MNILSRFLPRRSKPIDADAPTRPVESGFQPSRQPAAANGIRAELLRLTLRDTLRHHGLSRDWVTGDALATTSPQGQPGTRWCLTVRHWDLRLMVSLPAFQEQLLARLCNVDRTAQTWLLGVVWEFALPQDAPTPAMPSARYWTQARQTAVEAARPAASGDVISGPVHVDEGALARRQQLERELASRDGEYRHPAEVEATQPMNLHSRPGGLG